mmetsp:Transcript_40859/g.117074  ORF Transcript_40859/g.117074 Transcript_40859/m.117074 type:complete len:85 (+) Transcript_40859:400-654(+)
MNGTTELAMAQIKTKCRNVSAVPDLSAIDAIEAFEVFEAISKVFEAISKAVEKLLPLAKIWMPPELTRAEACAPAEVSPVGDGL